MAKEAAAAAAAAVAALVAVVVAAVGCLSFLFKFSNDKTLHMASVSLFFFFLRFWHWPKFLISL